jgi:CRISPR system Cascade subunit CasA
LIDDWPRLRIEQYLERWAGRFDLLDEERPFLQVPGLARVDKLELRPWTLLAFERASGNNRTLFDHTVDDNVSGLEPASAVRLLISHLQFTPGGLVRALRTSATRGAACGLLCVAAVARTLQETLALNLLPQSVDDYVGDLAAWESNPPTVDAIAQDVSVVPTGPAQRYTHLSRAVLLTSEDDTITGLRYAEGLSLEESPVPDPMAAQQRTDDGMRPLLLREERAFWRDLQALISDAQGTPPATIATAIAVRHELGDYTPLELLAGGLLPDKAKVVIWRLEERRISPKLLARDLGAAARLRPALQGAEDTGRALDSAIWDLCRHWLQGMAERSPAKGDIRAQMLQLNGMPRFWQALEPRFWALVDSLSDDADLDAAVHAWAEDLRRTAREAWTVTAGQLGASARALAAVAHADTAFGRAIAVAGKLTKE